MKKDARSMRIALVDDRYVNPPPGAPDALTILAAAGWGVMQLPAPGYPAPLAARMLADIAQEIAEFHQHGYQLIILGQASCLASLLAEVGLPVPDQFLPDTAAELTQFLARMA